ncbi:MAG: DUF1674 domain-containing protein [Pseudomonadota bacterium]
MSEISEEERARRAALPEPARRALAEADARRAARAAELKQMEAARDTESGGPTKIEPTRYGDWERKGIAYDF